jgi:hypothetical protein
MDLRRRLREIDQRRRGIDNDPRIARALGLTPMKRGYYMAVPRRLIHPPRRHWYSSAIPVGETRGAVMLGSWQGRQLVVWKSSLSHGEGDLTRFLCAASPLASAAGFVEVNGRVELGAPNDPSAQRHPAVAEHPDQARNAVAQVRRVMTGIDYEFCVRMADGWILAYSETRSDSDKQNAEWASQFTGQPDGITRRTRLLNTLIELVGLVDQLAG